MSTNTVETELAFPLSVGDYVTLYDTATVEYRDDGNIGGGTASILFEGAVEQFVPQTGKLSFAEETRSEDIGRAQFLDYAEQAAGVEILYDWDGE